MIPYKQEASAAAAASDSAIAILIVSLAVIAIVLYLRKRFKFDVPAQSADARVKVLESRRLSAHAVLTVVEFDGRELLLVQSQQGVNCVAEARPKEPAQ